MKKLTEDVKPSKISSAYVNAPFDVAKAELEKNGYRIISLEESARLNMDENSIHSEYAHGDGNGKYHFVREGLLYIPNKGIYITKNSPIIDFPEEATQAHREKREFYLTDKQVKHALEDSLWIPGDCSVPISEIEVSAKDPNNIDLKDKFDPFRNNVLTEYLFGDETERYGKFLRREKPVRRINIESKKVEPITIEINNESEIFSVCLGWYHSINPEKPFAVPLIFDDDAYGNPGISGGPMDTNGSEPYYFLNGNAEISEWFNKEYPNEEFNPDYFSVRGIKEVE
jgi:hypothetical protein